MSSTRTTMMAVLALALGGIPLGAMGAGCSSNPTYGDEASFCQALAQADCSAAAVTACYEPTQETFAEDTSACIAARSSYEQCNPQNLPYHPEGAAGCIAAQANLYASAPSLSPTLLQAAQQACAVAFNNGGETGFPCKLDTDCDVGSGLVCLLRATGTGSCQVPVPTSPGEACSSPTAQCVDQNGATDTFYCDSTNHCVADQGIGQPCGDAIPCDPTTNPPLRCVSGTCQDTLPDQSPCTANSDCQGGFCVAVASGSVCAGQPTLEFGEPSCTAFLGN